MSSSSFQKSLRTRCLLTGESRNQLLNPRGGMPFSDEHASIPAAVGDQAVLESWFMNSLQRFHASPAVSPLGISRIRVPALGTPTIHLDERVNPFDWCQPLLPFIDAYGNGSGVPRLRVVKVAGPNLILGLEGTPAELTVYADGVRWSEVLQQRREYCERFDCLPVWDSSRPIEGESSSCEMRKPMAWLGSSLFRRSAAFRQAGRPCQFDAWFSPDGWVLEFTVYLPSGGYPCARRHDEYLELLLDEHLGLPLRVERETCICSDPLRGSICFSYLVPHDEESAGRVELRFCWDSEESSRKYRERRAAHVEVCDRSGLRPGKPGVNR